MGVLSDGRVQRTWALNSPGNTDLLYRAPLRRDGSLIGELGALLTGEVD